MAADGRFVFPGAVRAARACCALAIALAAASAFAEPAEDWTARAREQAVASRYGDALASVDSALARRPGDFDARVLRARVLSWQGRYADADAELRALLAERPGDADAGLAAAYLRYYRGDLRGAEESFGSLLAADSGNSDARAGLVRVRKALAAPPSRPWRVDAGGEYSTFARRPQPAWNQQYLQVSRSLEGGATSVYGRIERYRQFDLSDVSLAAGVVRVFHPRLNASFEVGWTADPDFRPDWRAAAEAAFLALQKPASDLAPAAWLLAGLRYDSYDATKVTGFHPGIRLEWGPPWAVTARADRVNDGGDALYGWTARFDGSLGLPRLGPVSGCRFWAGGADAPETVRAATVSTRSLFAGLGADVGAIWSFTLGYVRDDREGSWVRHAVNAGASRRF